MLHPEIDFITVLDFGGQYAHLIANRVRGLGVYSVVVQPEDFDADMAARGAGLILSGGPQSVTDGHVAMMRPRLEGYNKPMLGICFGHQLLAKLFGGELAHGRDRQYGPTPIRCAAGARLFAGLPAEQSVWMSHGDHVAKVPPGFRVVATSDSCAVAAYEAEGRDLFGLQFHPEVVHTPGGSAMLKNFLALCRIAAPWEGGSMRQRVIEQTREAAGDSTLFLLVSGGVDSLVALQVCIEAVGAERVRSLHVDTGLMRLGESDDILKFLAASGFRNIEIERAETLFLKQLAGVAEPEQKRAIIGRLFVEVLREKMRTLKLGGNWKLVQGTIYPDTIESGGTKNAALIKTHHNRVPEIQEMIDRGLVVEPLRELYKDEVRLLGRELGLPQALLDRHPCPGPGLGIRLLCHDGAPAPTVFADQPKLEEELTKMELCGRILPVKSVGVQGDERSYRHPAAVWSRDGKWPGWEALNAVANRLVNQLGDINRVMISLEDLSVERFELRKTFATREGLDRLRDVDHRLHRRIAHIAEIWQAPVISLPLFDRAGNQAFVLRPVCSKDAMTADVYPIDFALLAELAREVRAVPGAGVLFYDITTKPPGTIEWE